MSQQAFGLVGNVTGAFPKERKIVDRERASNSYHISAYYMAKVRASPSLSRNDHHALVMNILLHTWQFMSELPFQLRC
eukprot:46003-Eustigmatos_ZCMA.PRE.1